ncbi:MAG: gliding motility-associated C-terminal domain-containing protein [Bacteroidetes bacterium]|nr:gliding motility-associated C-terminal domain-containing protein [Bacteroidota bacterium]
MTKRTLFIWLMYIFFIPLLWSGTEAFAQFTGGDADGLSYSMLTQGICTPGNNNIYMGGTADGFSYSNISQASCVPGNNNIYSGGTADGFSYSNITQVCGSIPVQATVTVTTQNMCSGQCTATASAAATGGSAPYTYSWNSIPVQATKIATGLCAGTYSVLVTDSNSKTDTAAVIINQLTALTATVTSIEAACINNNGTATITPGGGTPGYTYSWNNGQTTTTATGLAIGDYTATVTDANGCSYIQPVSVMQTPTQAVSATASSYAITSGDSTTLTAGGAGYYQWSPSTGLSCSTCANTTAGPLQTTDYCVTITDTISGCSDSACITLTLLQELCEVYIPNAFSPNADGQNDLLKVHGDCIKELSFIIYDRWGEKVFETTDLSIAMIKGWDGIYKGKPLNTAVFVYYFTASLNNETPVELTGNISLLR